jgi:hypothetical protein
MSEAAKKITTFLFQTIKGFERALYRKHYLEPQLNSNWKEAGFDFKSREHFEYYCLVSHVYYFNSLHKSLVLKNDKYVIDSFNDFQASLKDWHSPICLLNIMIQVSQTWHLTINRNKCNVTDLAKYSQSIESQLNQSRNDITDKLTKCLSHKCNGLPLETEYDESRPMFTTEMTPIYQETEEPKEVKVKKESPKYAGILIHKCQTCQGTATKKCRCGLWYCGKECQKRDWSFHKLVCSVKK